MSTPSAGASRVNCPRCGQAATGKFCSGCGSPLRDRSCPECHVSLSAGAKFCHRCGSPLGGRRKSATSATPWLVAGAAVVSLVAVVILASLRGPDTPPAAAVPAAGAAGASSAGGPAAVDLASLTPRQRADRLYDRIMRAHEQGDTSQIRTFTPMALQAYEMLGELDNDARYHVGLIHTVTGDPAAALAQADSMDAGNLMAAMLRQRTASSLGDAEASRRAYVEFLASYDSEIAIPRPEYEAHRSLIDSFLAEARRVTSGEGS